MDILNTTNIDIPVIIEILSQSTLIEIKNISNNQSFKINRTINENEKMVIDSNTCDVFIVNLLDGTKKNAIKHLVAGSQFIMLSMGLNKIEINNGIANKVPLSYIRYNTPSLAV